MNYDHGITATKTSTQLTREYDDNDDVGFVKQVVDSSAKSSHLKLSRGNRSLQKLQPSPKRVDACKTTDDDIKDIIKYESVNAVYVRKVSADLEQAIEQQTNITEVAIAECNSFSRLPKVPILRLSGCTDHNGGAIKIIKNLTNATKQLHMTLFVNAYNTYELLELQYYFDINVEKLSLSVYVKDVGRTMPLQKYIEVLRKSLINIIMTIKRGLHTAPAKSLRVSLIFPKCSKLEHTDCDQLIPLMDEFGGKSVGEHLTYTRFEIPFPVYEEIFVHVEVLFKAAYSANESVCFDNFLLNSYLDIN
uniref:F-box domain-containing protein n=1 Tax=Panagrellus redivivus TaxID=6233 RepID=A0A7E4V5W4_PANRE